MFEWFLKNFTKKVNTVDSRRASNPVVDLSHPTLAGLPIEQELRKVLPISLTERQTIYYPKAELNPVVVACQQQIVAEITRREYVITHPDGLSKKALSQIDLVKNYFYNGMPNETMTWSKFFEHLSSYRNRGFSPVEIVWQMKSGIYTPKGLYPIPCEAFRFIPDSLGDFTPSVLNMRSPTIGEPLKPYSWLCIFHHQNPQNIYGVALFDVLYPVISAYEDVLNGYLQELREGGKPHIFCTYDRDAEVTKEQRQADFNAIKKLTQTKTIMVSDVYRVDAHYFNNPKIIETYDTMLKYIHKSITQVLCGHAQTLEQGDSGSRAAAEVYSEIPRAITEGITNEIAFLVNQLIDYIYTLNEWEEEKPIFGFTEKSDLNKVNQQLDIFLKAHQLGIPLSLSQIRQSVNLDNPVNQEDVLKDVESAFSEKPDFLSIDKITEDAATAGNQATDKMISLILKELS